RRDRRTHVGHTATCLRKFVRRPTRNVVRNGRTRYDGARFRIAENMRNLPVAIKNIDRNNDHAALDARKVNVDHLRAVREVYAEPVAWPEAPGVQQLRQPVASGIDLAERRGRSFKLERNLIAASAQR